MTFAEYQRQAATTAYYPGRQSVDGLLYVTLGLTGEAGETAEQVKKMLRDDGGTLPLERRDKIIGELGDVLWYLSCICDELGTNLEAVARKNNQKLADRKARNVLHGEGNDR